LFNSAHISFSFYSYDHHRDLHSFPTRRSSDLTVARTLTVTSITPDTPFTPSEICVAPSSCTSLAPLPGPQSLSVNPTTRIDFTRDRKSTRLNSSHVAISYAVFCLKKKIRLVTQ